MKNTFFVPLKGHFFEGTVSCHWLLDRDYYLILPNRIKRNSKILNSFNTFVTDDIYLCYLVRSYVLMVLIQYIFLMGFIISDRFYLVSNLFFFICIIQYMYVTVYMCADRTSNFLF